MNREILFRGRQECDDKWVLGHYVGCDCIEKTEDYYTGECRKYGEHFYAVVSPETVGQYTGLTDRNGKRIFEGDIVLKRTYNGKRPFPVTFNSGMFHAGYGGGSSTATHGYTLDDRQIEVIGNIHDNPELLERGRPD